MALSFSFILFRSKNLRQHNIPDLGMHALIVENRFGESAPSQILMIWDVWFKVSFASSGRPTHKEGPPERLPHWDAATILHMILKMHVIIRLYG